MWFLCFCKFKLLKFFLFLYFLNFWSIPSKKGTYWSTAKLIYPYRVELFIFTPILRHIEWKLWTSIKVSQRLDKHLSICFLILFFFLQLAEFNLKAPLYSKTLHYSRISISRAPSPFRSIYNRDQGNSPCVNAKFPFFIYLFFYYFSKLFNGEIFYQLSGSTIIFVKNTHQKAVNLMFHLILPVAKGPWLFLEVQYILF